MFSDETLDDITRQLAGEDPGQAEGYAQDARVLAALRGGRDEAEAEPALAGFADDLMDRLEREQDVLRPGPAAPLPYAQAPALTGGGGGLLSLGGLWQAGLAAAAAALLTAGLGLLLGGPAPSAAPLATPQQPENQQPEAQQPGSQQPEQPQDEGPAFAFEDRRPQQAQPEQDLPELAVSTPAEQGAQSDPAPAPRRRLAPGPSRGMVPASGGGSRRSGQDLEQLQELLQNGLRRVFLPPAEEGDEVRF